MLGSQRPVLIASNLGRAGVTEASPWNSNS
jgi:hypothetical protein